MGHHQHIFQRNLEVVHTNLKGLVLRLDTFKLHPNIPQYRHWSISSSWVLAFAFRVSTAPYLEPSDDARCLQHPSQESQSALMKKSRKAR
ncbi:hypothetical protein A0H81_06973 [Grifola frondosa]|nr:hypothetical protein A0H81_06973 [Grifola frondosa]